MKILIWTGVLLILGGVGGAVDSSGIYFDVGDSGTWMSQAGLVLLVGALVIFLSKKRSTVENSLLLRAVEIGSFVLMLFLILLGFLTGRWNAYPLGAIISIVGGCWVIYRITKDRKHEV